MERPRKAPAVERSVSEITEEDIRVRVMGTAKKIEDGHFTLEDETGSIRVESQDSVADGTRIRVFARPTMVSNALMLSSELVQDISGLNEKIYKKIKTQGL